MAEPALQLPPEEDNEIDASDLIRQRDGDNAIDISDQIRARDAVPDVNESPDGQQPNIVDRGLDAKDQFDQAKDIYGKGKEKLATRSAKKAGKEGLKEGVEKQGAAAAKRKVATQGAQQVAKAGAKTAATTAAKAGATAATLGAEAAAGPVGWVLGALTVLSIIGKPLLNFVKNHWQYAVYAVAALLLLLAVPFGLLGGKGVGQYPATARQETQAQSVAYISGDFISGNQITQKIVESEKKRYAIVNKNVAGTTRAAEVKKASDEIILLMGLAVSLNGEPKTKMIKDINSKVRALDSTLPYGEWIAEEAEKHIGKVTNFCEITGNDSPNLGCASVVSVIMNRAGAPQRLETGQFAIWRNARLMLIVDALPDHKLSRDLYTQNKDKFQRGDIIWWGNGIRKGKVVGLQSHIGIYIGNGQVVNNSSGKSIKAGEAVPVSSRIDRTDTTFNGAKRYGATL